MKKAALLPALLLGLLATGCVVQPVGTVAVDMPDASMRIGVRSYPELVLVPGSPVYYAPWVDQNYFFYDGMYWVFEGDNWYASYWFNGPWSYVRVDYVPVFILRVPVYYYRRPPVYFRHWRAGDPPRWDERYGPDWDQRHPEWRRHDGVVPAPAPRPDYQRRYSGKHYPSPAQQQQLREQNYTYRPREHVELVPGSRPAGTPASPQRPDRMLDRDEQWQQRQDQLQQRQDQLQLRRQQQGQEREDRQQDRLPPGMRPDGRQPGNDGRSSRDDRDEQQRRQSQWQDWQDRQRRQADDAAPDPRHSAERTPQDRLPVFAPPSPVPADPRGRRETPWPPAREVRDGVVQERLPLRPETREDAARPAVPERQPRNAIAAPPPRELPVPPVVAVPERGAPSATGAPTRESRPARKEAPARKPARGDADAEHSAAESPGQ